MGTTWGPHRWSTWFAPAHCASSRRGITRSRVGAMNLHLAIRVIMTASSRHTGQRSGKGTLVGRVYDVIDDTTRQWLARQPMFFVATAPDDPDGHVNLSPKGGAGAFRVLGPTRVA